MLISQVQCQRLHAVFDTFVRELPAGGVRDEGVSMLSADVHISFCHGQSRQCVNFAAVFAGEVG